MREILDQRGSSAMATVLGNTVGRQIEVLSKGQSTSSTPAALAAAFSGGECPSVGLGLICVFTWEMQKRLNHR